MKCPEHQGRGRAPKACSACTALREGTAGTVIISALPPFPAPEMIDAIASVIESDDDVMPRARHHRNPRLPLSADGLTWVDAEGNPPEVDERGTLTKDFLLVLPTKSERFTVGCILPRIV